METLIGAALLAAGIVAAAVLLTRHRPLAHPAAPAAPGDLPVRRDDAQHELRERRAEIVRIEERILNKEESLDARMSDLLRRERVVAERELELEGERARLVTRLSSTCASSSASRG